MYETNTYKSRHWVTENANEGEGMGVFFGNDNLLVNIHNDSGIELWQYDTSGDIIKIKDKAENEYESYKYILEGNILNLSGLDGAKMFEGRYKEMLIEVETEQIELPPIDQDDFKSYRNWMGGMNLHNFLLNQICIPGTHDSGAFGNQSNPANNWILTQRRTFEEQLNDGIRFLDLRLSTYLDFFHGRVHLGHNFESFMNVAKKFLEENTGEVIVASIKYEDGNDWIEFDRNLREKFLENPKWKDLFYLGTSIPRYKHVKGKIVLLRRFRTIMSDLGIPVSDWKDNTIFELTDSLGNVIRVQDCYDLKGEENEKTGVIVKEFELAHEQLKKWHINFFSHICRPTAGIETVAVRIMNKFKETQSYKNLQTKYYSGCYPMDYYDMWLVHYMICSNKYRRWGRDVNQI